MYQIYSQQKAYLPQLASSEPSLQSLDPSQSNTLATHSWLRVLRQVNVPSGHAVSKRKILCWNKKKLHCTYLAIKWCFPALVWPKISKSALWNYVLKLMTNWSVCHSTQFIYLFVISCQKTSFSNFFYWLCGLSYQQEFHGMWCLASLCSVTK